MEYPALHRNSDAASLRAQRAHFILLRCQLVLFFVASAGAGAISIVPPWAQREITTGITIVLAGALILMWMARYRQDERIWFNCRAIAESVKSVTWLYIMQAPPFYKPNAATSDKDFTDRLREILRTWPGVESYFAAEAPPGPVITESMRQVLEMSFESRKDAYLRFRLTDQRGWYAEKCKANRSRAGRWFLATVGLQIGALVAAILQVRYGPTPVNVISPLMTLSASFVAWSQSRRYEELAQEYALAALELDMLDGLASDVHEGSALREIVVQIEGAISREHKMWCVRRSVKAGT